jgi:hypothetical protein
MVLFIITAESGMTHDAVLWRCASSHYLCYRYKDAMLQDEILVKDLNMMNRINSY